MTENELKALRYAASGMLLFHNGLWGASAGYRWAGADGLSAGHVPQWACEALDLLEQRGLVAVRPARGARDGAVELTSSGARTLSTVEGIPVAA